MHLTKFFINNFLIYQSRIKGRFDKYVQSDAKKRGTANVDDEFLKSIEEWRTYLATTIALRNKSLGEDEINYAVQKNIDRIIFLRICEDRGIEQYGDLKNAIKKGVFYQNLFEFYHIADEKYNSGLFDFREDTITPSLTVDNKVVKNIISELYYPVSPYEFSVFPADILGSVYERFLGKTIRLTKAHHAKIEEKPEVRKAGGVYYTPKYIVDYIVENTVGKLIKDKKPKDIEKIKIVDPACGSGSFLIGAYQSLLDRHLQYYTENPPKKKKDNPLTPDGNLTTAEKKCILLNNIYGVDIDAQAVEVTKLNLLLKALEGETNASISKQLSFFNERVLPNLEDNIKCGNSLIGTDFYDTQLELFPETIKKINAFDWDKAFPEIFKNGGFDAVIGNPPYVRQELIKTNKNYFSKQYETYYGTADLYQYFIEKGILILKEKGIFCYIVANKWMRAKYGEPLRKWIKKFYVLKIIDFDDLPVFKPVITYPCILIVQNSKASDKVIITNVETLDFNKLDEYENNHYFIIKKQQLQEIGWKLIKKEKYDLLEKIKTKSISLSEYVNGKIFYGIKTGLNEAFVISENCKNQLIAEDPKSSEIIKPFLAGRDIKRYKQPQSNNYLIFAKKGIDISKFPAVENYLFQYKEKLIPKPKNWKGQNWKGRAPGNYKWFELQASPSDTARFETNKIIVPAIVKNASYAFDERNYYSNDKTTVIPLDDKYLLGILNSQICDYFLKNIAATKQNNYFEYKPMYLIQLPIYKVDFQNKKEKQIHNTIVQLVDNLLNLNKELQSTKLDTQRQQLQCAIDHAENKIDELVYGLYGLTEEEIGIVENLK